MPSTYLTSQGDTLDYICWKFYGGQQSGAVEAVLLANQNLSRFDVVLPENTEVILPDLPEPTREQQPIRLWD